MVNSPKKYFLEGCVSFCFLVIEKKTAKLHVGNFKKGYF